MKKHIYIIGTDHRYQNGSMDFTEDQHEGFRSALANIAEEYQIKLIAEENNTEALNENGITQSVPQKVAANVNTRHLFTEADRGYRAKNGMKQENDIRASGFMNNLNDEEIRLRVEESYRNRENYWLKQIIEADCWPVLFICGANHAEEFSKLVLSKGFECVVLFKDWCN